MIAHVNGVAMHYEVGGTGRPLVLLHGFTGCGADWRHVFSEPLAGHQVVAPDLRGHGQSTNPSGAFTFRESAADVLGLLDTLGIDRFSAIGMSAGAMTLLHIATAAPSRVNAMVLVSAAPYFPREARMLMAQMTDRDHSDEEWRTMRERHRHGDEQIRALWRQGCAFKDSYDDMSFTPPALSTITARTLIVHGDRDPFYPVRLALEMYAAIANAYLWVVPNGGHGPIFGSSAPPFVEAASAFLSSD